MAQDSNEGDARPDLAEIRSLATTDLSTPVAVTPSPATLLRPPPRRMVQPNPEAPRFLTPDEVRKMPRQDIEHGLQQRHTMLLKDGTAAVCAVIQQAMADRQAISDGVVVLVEHDDPFMTTHAPELRAMLPRGQEVLVTWFAREAFVAKLDAILDPEDVARYRRQASRKGRSTQPAPPRRTYAEVIGALRRRPNMDQVWVVTFACAIASATLLTIGEKPADEPKKLADEATTTEETPNEPT